jgi:hypothetical protein
MRASLARNAVPVVVGLAVLLVSSAAIPNGIRDGEGVADTGLYQEYGERVRDGLIPYRDFSLEFPPGSLVPIVVSAVTGGSGGYVWRFKALQAAMLALAVVATVAALAGMGAGRGRRTLGACLVGATPLLLGPLALNALDAWPALLVAAGAAALVWLRPVAGGTLIGLGAAAKLYPILLVPVLLAWAGRTLGRRRGILLLLALVAGGLLLAVPFAAVAPGGLRFSLSTQLERGLQVESLGGSLLLALGTVGIGDPHVVIASPFSFDVAGSTARAVGAVSSVAELAAVLLPAILLLRSRRSPTSPALVLALAAATAGLLAFNKVFSGQYLVWLVPAVALTSSRAAWVLTVQALVLTHIWYPAFFEEVTRGESIVWLVLLRNLVVLATAVVCLRALSSDLAQNKQQQHGEDPVPGHRPPHLAVEIEGARPPDRPGDRHRGRDPEERESRR